MNDLNVVLSTGEIIGIKRNDAASKIHEMHEKACNCADQAIEFAIKAGELLLEAKEQTRHGEWLPFVESTGMSARTAQGYMRLAKHADEVNTQGLAHLGIEKALKLLAEPKGQPANYSSESEEWYTPDEYMQTVRDFFNGITLDPCSCEKANETVGAEHIFTKDDDSLTRQWHGRVFMNPPYGKDGSESVAGIFCDKAISEYKDGNAEEVIILVNSSHTQKWQRNLYDYTVCFVDHRIKFIAGDGSENSNPTFGNIFVYLGDRKEEFAAAFSKHGYVMEKIDAC